MADTEYVRVQFKGGTALVSRQDFERGNWVKVEDPSLTPEPVAGKTDVDYVRIHFKGGTALAARAEVEAGLWTRVEDPVPTPKQVVVGSEPVNPPPANPVEPPVTHVTEEDGEDEGEVDVEDIVDPVSRAYDPSPVEPVRRKRGRPPKIRV